MMEKDFSYSDVEDSYKENLYFDLINIIINIKVKNPQSGRNQIYKIKKVKCNYDNGTNNDLKKKVEGIVNDINTKMNFDISKYQNNWSLFYLYKEILQKLNRDYNFSRGQCTDWPMLPGLIRKNTNDELKNNFELNYKDIMYRYPNLIEYFPPLSHRENINKREQQLAHLQHYGMKTSLIDITENPFIAMLFMVSDTSSKNFEFATLDLFNINQEIHDKNNLFSKVKQLNTNQRIIAQKGAFLNFDKVILTTSTPSKVDKIPLIRIRLNIKFNHLKKIKEELKQKRKEYKKLEKDYESYINNLNNDADSQGIPKELKENLRNMIDARYKVNKLKEQTSSLEEYYKDIVLSRIRIDIKNKLSEYHYTEKQLYPDLYKHIQYVESEYIEKRQNKHAKSENVEVVSTKEKIADFL